MTRINDDRKVADFMHSRHHLQIDNEAGCRLMSVGRGDAAFAEHDIGVSLIEQVLGRAEPIAKATAEMPLQQDRLFCLGYGFQQRKVLHVPRTDLDHVDPLGKQLDETRVHQLRDNGQACASACLRKEVNPPLPQFECLGRTVWERQRLERPAPQNMRSFRLDLPRDFDGLIQRFDRTRSGNDR